MRTRKAFSGGAPRAVLPVLLAALLTAAVFATGALDKGRTWSEMVYLNLDFPMGASLSAGDGEHYGVMNAGPGFHLPAGTYRLKWRVQSDGENGILLSAENNARIIPSRIHLAPGDNAGEAAFTVLDAADGFQLQAVFEQGTYIDVLDFRLYSPAYRDGAFTFAFLSAAVCALLAARRRGALTPERRGRLLVIGFAVLLASAPSLKDGLSLGQDGLFHMARVENLADGLRSGQFPVRVGGFSYNGYGAATSAMYPDVFLYPAALLRLGGASIQYAMHVCEIALNAAAAGSMYVCARRIFGDREIAACACVLYTLAVYRLTDVYVRCALGEATAMSLLPLFLLGLWEAVFGDKSRWRLLAASAAGICLCHLLSTLMCAAFALGVMLLFLGRIVREGRFCALLKAAFAAAALCAFWLVPFARFGASGVGAQSIRGVMQDRALAPAQLLLWGEGDLPVDPLDLQLSELPAEIGLPLLLGALAVLWLLTTGRAARDGRLRAALLFVFAGGVAALMATTLFPWGAVSALTRGLSDYLQFPWRFLMFPAALLSLAGAYGYSRLAGNRDGAAVFAALALSAVFALPTLSAHARLNNALEFGQGATSALTHPEYQLPGTDVRDTLDRDWHAVGDVTVTGYVKDGTRVTARVDARGESALSLPLFGFGGYAAALNGERIGWTPGDNNRLTVLLPAGASGELRVWYEGERVWRIFDTVSLLAWLGLLLPRRRRAVNGAVGIRDAS